MTINAQIFEQLNRSFHFSANNYIKGTPHSKFTKFACPDHNPTGYTLNKEELPIQTVDRYISCVLCVLIILVCMNITYKVHDIVFHILYNLRRYCIMLSLYTYS